MIARMFDHGLWWKWTGRVLVASGFDARSTQKSRYDEVSALVPYVGLQYERWRSNDRDFLKSSEIFVFYCDELIKVADWSGNPCTTLVLDGHLYNYTRAGAVCLRLWVTVHNQFASVVKENCEKSLGFDMRAREITLCRYVPELVKLPSF